MFNPLKKLKAPKGIGKYANVVSSLYIRIDSVGGCVAEANLLELLKDDGKRDFDKIKATHDAVIEDLKESGLIGYLQRNQISDDNGTQFTFTFTKQRLQTEFKEVREAIKKLKTLFRPKDPTRYKKYYNPDTCWAEGLRFLIEAINDAEPYDDMSNWNIFSNYDIYFEDIIKPMSEYIEKCNVFNCLSDKIEKITSLQDVKAALNKHYKKVLEKLKEYKAKNKDKKAEIKQMEKNIKETKGTGDKIMMTKIELLVKKREINLQANANANARKQSQTTAPTTT